MVTCQCGNQGLDNNQEINEQVFRVVPRMLCHQKSAELGFWESQHLYAISPMRKPLKTTLSVVRMVTMPEPFLFVAGHLTLDFVNTLDYRYDKTRRIDLLPTFESFVRFAAQAALTSEDEARKLRAKTDEREAAQAITRVVQFREALYFLLLSSIKKKPPNALHLRSYNRILKEATLPNFVAWHKKGFVVSIVDQATSPVGLLKLIIESANRLLTSSDLRYLGECQDQSCRWLFLDHSKNHSRRWCSMEICGNRTKARKFYAQNRSPV
jgi:predicted RNA-binding Zn ribbon-like protein